MWVKILLITAGIIFWTFLEYIIHRFWGHQNKRNGIIRKEHLLHHAQAHYFAPLYKKITLAVMVLAASTFLTGLLFGWLNGFFFSIGLAGMYFVYELTHRLFHTNEPLIRYGLRMRKHHFYHHFGNTKGNHGVTTAIWDRIFKTYKAVGQISVPKKMAMLWLLEDDQNVKSKYSKHFRLREQASQG